jgi:hypothetical protein
VDGPYRDLSSPSRHQAASRDGPVTLEVGPQHVRVELGPRMRLTASAGAATWVRERRGGAHRRELPLGPARLWAARSFPARDLALWFERRPGQVERLGGVRAVPPFEPDALAAWRALDRLSGELARALAAHGGAAPAHALELGRGSHRVLLVEADGGATLYARPLFRERPRRALDLGPDGALSIPGQARAGRLTSRDQVTVAGDRICFTGEAGRALAVIWLPWIAAADRHEIARRLGELVDPSPPEPDYEPRTGPRAWASGLGRTLPHLGLARRRPF